MPNFMAFVLTDLLVRSKLKEKKVENNEEAKTLATQLPLFAALFSRRNGGGLSSAVFPAFIAQGIAATRADEIARASNKAVDLIKYIDVSKLPRDAAKNELLRHGFNVIVNGNTDKFKSQTPEFKEGRFLRRGTTVTLEYELKPD